MNSKLKLRIERLEDLLGIIEPAAAPDAVAIRRGSKDTGRRIVLRPTRPDGGLESIDEPRGGKAGKKRGEPPQSQ